MDTIVINGEKYKMPTSVVEHNLGCSDFYGVLNIAEVLTGREDFDRIESENGDWFESECFEAYGNHYGVNGDDAPINEVGSAMYAWFTDYKGEDFSLHLLEKVN
jgi:hypothetical protein